MNRHERRKMKKFGITINNDEANKEFKAAQEMVNQDHEKLLEYNKKHQALIGSQEPNWALYNYIMSLVSFENCKTKNDAMHLLWRHLWPHLNKLCLENDLMKTYLIQDIKCPDDILARLKESSNPEVMAEEVLKLVSELARKRAKLRSYQIALAKDKSAQILES